MPFYHVLSVQCYVFDSSYDVVQQISRTYPPCLTETLCRLISNSLFYTLLQPLATTILLFHVVSLTNLDTSYKGSHAAFVLRDWFFHLP